MLGNIMTIVICVVLMVGLGIVLVKLIRGLFAFVSVNAKGAKSMLTQPGAIDAFEILENAAKSGRISESDMELAITTMLEKGSTESQVGDFINYCLYRIKSDADWEHMKLMNKKMSLEWKLWKLQH